MTRGAPDRELESAERAGEAAGERVRSLQLADLHRAAGASLEVDVERGVELPRRFADARREQAAFATSAGLVDASWQGVADLRGPNVARVLRGVFTSAVTNLSPGEGQPSALLTARGRIVALFHIFLLAPDRCRLVFTEPARPGLLRQIERYVALSDIAVEERDDSVAVLAVQGPRTTDVLAAAGWTGDLAAAPLCLARGEIAGAPVDACRGGPTPEGGCLLWVPRAALAEVWERLAASTREAGGLPAGAEAFDALRIEAGRARYRCEYDDESFPNEVRWEHALTYDKCYVGQEIVARMKTYGEVHRRLKGLRLPDGGEGGIARGAALLAGDEDAGIVTSTCASVRLDAPIALALVKRKHWDRASVEVETPAGRVEAEVVELPFVARRREWTDPAADAPP